MTKIQSIFLYFFLFYVTTVSAHHAPGAIFSRDTITIEGTVTSFNLRNPHTNITIDVTGDDGVVTSWIAEGPATTRMRSFGWDSSTIQPGQYIRMVGEKALNDRPMIEYRNHIHAIEIINLASNETTNATENSLINMVPAKRIDSLSLMLEENVPNLSGIWSHIWRASGPRERSGLQNTSGRAAPFSEGQRGPWPWNELGQAVADNWQATSDSAIKCEEQGLVRQTASAYPILITQEENRVLIKNEEFGSTREVFLRETFEDNGLSNLGDSRAYYQDDKLIIETINLFGNPTIGMGNTLSDQTTTTEIYERVDDGDGPAIKMSIIINDPGHLTEEHIISWTKHHEIEYPEFAVFECFAK